MRSKKEHSAQIFGVRFFLEYESLTVYFVALELYEERGRATRKNFGQATYCSRDIAGESCVVV